MTFYIPQGLDGSSGLLGDINRSVRNSKSLIAAGIAAGALSIAPMAEAQARQRNPDAGQAAEGQAPVRRPAGPLGYAVPRDMVERGFFRDPRFHDPRSFRDPRIPADLRFFYDSRFFNTGFFNDPFALNYLNQFSVGINVRTGRFGLDFYYSGSPFGRIPVLGHFPGYFDGDIFYLLCHGPRPRFRSEMAYLQFLNVWRPNAPIGAYKHRGIIGHYEWGQPAADWQPGQIVTGDQSPVNIGDNNTVIYGSSGTERTANERPSVTMRYGGKIDRTQYDDEAIRYLDGMFDSMRLLTNEDVDLVPYDAGSMRIEIRDRNANQSVVGEIDISRYPNCLSVDHFLDSLSYDLSRAVDFEEYPGLPTRARSHLQVVWSDFSAPACR